MCGIAGIVGLEPGQGPTTPELEQMIGTLRHRGPDDATTFVDDQVGLGHTRLSIIDLAGGQQPVHNEDKTVWVIFNGEIFNYIELRSDLRAKGHTFHTSSDTEVIVHAYEEYGLDFVHQFNGQWAIALWDKRKRRLVLARDRVGVRPVLYTRTGGRLAFASEAKALFRLDGVPRRLDRKSLAQVLHYWVTLEPRTIFDGVCSLPPGHLLIVEGGRIRTQQYWDWSFPCEPPPSRPLMSTVEELRALLIDSVRLRLRADVPVGAYLSGGVDSSIITAVIKNFTDTPLRTFSIGFEDPALDESVYQNELVEHLGTHHTAIRCTTGDIGQAFPRTVWHAETSLVRTAATPLMLLSGAVRAHEYKVVLTGEGADEVFGGYDLFKEAQARRFWARQPGSRFRASILSRLYPHLTVSPTASTAYAQSFFGRGLDRSDEPFFGHLPRWTTTARIWRFFSQEQRDALTGWDPLDDLRVNLPPDIGRWEPFCRDQYIEAHTLLAGYLLSSQGDRVGMANSVEGRFPYLDVRLLAFASHLPIIYKMHGLREKYLLKKAMSDLLPVSIVDRPKQPYRAPDSLSFFRDGRPLPYVADLLSADRMHIGGYFDPGSVGKLVDKCASGKAIGFGDNMAFVAVLSTMLIDEMFVRRTSTWEDLTPPTVNR